MKITNIFKKEKTMLEKEIDSVLEELREYDVTDDNYEIVLDRLKTLYGLNSDERKWSVSKDTMVVVGGNLLVAVLVLKHEDMNIITSKVLGFLIKGRA